MYEQLQLLVSFVFGYVLRGLSVAVGGSRLLVLLCAVALLSSVVNLVLALRGGNGKE